MGFLVSLIIVALIFQAELTFKANREFYYARHSKDTVKYYFIRKRMRAMNIMLIIGTILSMVAINLLLRA